MTAGLVFGSGSPRGTPLQAQVPRTRTSELGGEEWSGQLVFHSRSRDARLVVNMVGCSTATLWVGRRKGIELSSSFSAAVCNIDREITSSIGLPADYGR